jgi:hypothetical protein
MDRAELQKILQQSEETDLAVLITAKEEAKQMVRDKPTPAALAALRQASAMLKEHVEQNPMEEDQPETGHQDSELYEETKRGSAVLRWLQACGYQREKSQFYDDIKFGRLRSNNDGVFTVRLVKKYARTLPRIGTGKTEAEEKMDLGQQKQQEEIEKLRLHNSKAKFEFDVEQGKYFPREDFERELAARLVVLDSGIERLIRDSTAKMIHISGGDQKNSEHLIDFLVAAKNDLLNSYATTKTYHVLIMPKETPVGQK